MSQSPYAGKIEGPEWLEVTQGLIGSHPFGASDDHLVGLRKSCQVAWDLVWETTVGSGPQAVRLTELEVPATVVGYFFEILLARQLALQFPQVWRGNQGKEEKDLVCLTDVGHSVEIKTSGQLGLKVFGNRSHGQQAANESLVKKEKSGYYLTVNFSGHVLTLLRFGWIDAGDWDPQEAPTGQMAGLKESVYRYKLRRIRGAYMRSAPVRLLKDVGEKTEEKLATAGIKTFGELIDSGDTDEVANRIRSKNRDILAECVDPES